MFEIVPAVDLKAGRCVRLVQGRADAETVFSDDPVAMARRWQDAGARRLHVVDLDGAFAGRPSQTALVRAMIEAVSIPVIASGGAGRLEHLREGVVEGGADAVLVASLFHFGQHTVAEAKRYLDERGVPVRLGP
jgi:phosphoribosylformimino-5-aminoimidazole carboxamide ribotide isomerase